jgi:hypothetical protein
LKAALLAVLLLWQLGSHSGSQPGSQPSSQPGSQPSAADPEPQHLRYQRDVQLPPAAAGQACVVLDADVFAHASDITADDLRLYATPPATSNTNANIETPFAMTESAPEPSDAETVAVQNAVLRNGRLGFDLTMPPRAYSEIDLQLDAKNFLGVADVWGSDAEHPAPVSLGAHSIFDLSGQGLARSTILSLQESHFAHLHIELRLMDLNGHPLSNLSPGIVTAATVPSGRSAQTLYTTVASTTQVDSQYMWSLATLTVPAHVPLEQVRFVVDPKFTRDFLRQVTVAASPIGSGSNSIGAAESVAGQIFRVTRRAVPGEMPAVTSQRLSLDATLGSNLRSSANVMASIHNGSDAPLPIQRVELQMRERAICFQALPGLAYTLRYGDAALHAPSYVYAQHFQLVASPIVAALGPERLNPHFVPHSVADGYGKRHPEMPWTLLLAALTISGVVALQFLRQRRGEMR